jgi:hypothetical protein
MLTDDDLAVWAAGLDDSFGWWRASSGGLSRGLERGRTWGVLAPLASKNGWTLAEAAGDATPDGMQRSLKRAGWDADGIGIRDDVRG